MTEAEQAYHAFTYLRENGHWEKGEAPPLVVRLAEEAGLPSFNYPLFEAAVYRLYIEELLP